MKKILLKSSILAATLSLTVTADITIPTTAMDATAVDRGYHLTFSDESGFELKERDGTPHLIEKYNIPSELSSLTEPQLQDMLAVSGRSVRFAVRKVGDVYGIILHGRGLGGDPKDIKSIKVVNYMPLVGNVYEIQHADGSISRGTGLGIGCNIL